VLKNKEVVAQAEKLLTGFKPADYDLGAHLKAIDAFEAKAVESAKQTSTKIEEELKQLQSALEDIESARPFEQLTVSGPPSSPSPALLVQRGLNNISLLFLRWKKWPRRAPRSKRRWRLWSRRASGPFLVTKRSMCPPSA
jgi:hypothetical protein